MPSRTLVRLLALCCCSTHALTPGGVVVRRSVQSEWPAGCAWIDITEQLSAALPPLPTALCHMHAPSTSFALVDGGLLDALGDADRTTVPASGQPELALAVQAGSAVLPLGARVVAMRPAEHEGPFDMSLSIETADAAADAQPPTHERLARATLQVCSAAAWPTPTPTPTPTPAPTPAARPTVRLQAALAALGVPLPDVEALEVPDRSSAAKVFSTFVKTGGAGGGNPPPQRDALSQAAVRAAHHITHLLRADRAAAASYLRNIDTYEAEAAVAGLPSHPITLVLDNLRSAYNVGR